MFSRKTLVVSFTAIVIVSMLAIPATGAGYARGEPDIEVFLPEPAVTPGEDTTLELQLLNDGNLEAGTQRGQVLTARGTTVTITDDGPFDVSTGTLSVGTIQDGATVIATPKVTVPETIEPGEYELTVRVAYSYTEYVSPKENIENSRSVREDHTITVRVLPESRFEIVSVTGDIQPGTGGAPAVEIKNVGEETARNARATISGGGGLKFDGGIAEASLGTLEPDESVTVNLDASLPTEATRAPKPITATISYRDSNGRNQEAIATSGSIVPLPEQSFELAELDASLSSGYGGVITGTIVNEGPRPVEGAVIHIDANSDAFAFDETQFTVSELDVGDTAQFQFKTGIDADVEPGPRQVTLRVEYRSDDGSRFESDPFTRRIDVTNHGIDIVDLSETLSVGYNGEIKGSIITDVGHPIDDGVLVIDPGSETLFVDENRYALPPLGADESVDFRYPVDVSGQADAGPRQVTFTVEYRDATGSVVQSDPITRRVVVSKRQPEFSLAAEDGTIEAGGSTTLVIEITNDRPEQLSNIDARLYAESPFDSTSDEAFVPALAPGESAELRFQLSAAAETMAKTYPVEFDFQFETEGGDTVISDTYQYPVEVQPPSEDDSGFPFEIALVGIALVVILGAGIVLRRRDRLPW